MRMTDAVCLGLDDSSAAGKKRDEFECVVQNRPWQGQMQGGGCRKGGLQDDTRCLVRQLTKSPTIYRGRKGQERYR